MAADESEEFRRFLKKLDDAADTLSVSDWEATFIESNLSREHFSPKQREKVMDMMEKYGKRIGWY
jgi:hypothetical protein